MADNAKVINFPITRSLITRDEFFGEIIKPSELGVVCRSIAELTGSEFRLDRLPFPVRVDSDHNSRYGSIKQQSRAARSPDLAKVSLQTSSVVADVRAPNFLAEDNGGGLGRVKALYVATRFVMAFNIMQSATLQAVAWGDPGVFCREQDGFQADVWSAEWQEERRWPGAILPYRFAGLIALRSCGEQPMWKLCELDDTFSGLPPHIAALANPLPEASASELRGIIDLVKR